MRLLATSLVLFLLCGCTSESRQHPVKREGGTRRQKQLFVVIDDAGLALHELQPFLAIPVPMTFAVLPHQKQTRDVCAALARHADKEIILHQPMEAYDRSQAIGAGGIYNTTPPAEVEAILNNNFVSVRGAVGMNNHMGSRVTENKPVMRAVLRYCKEQGLFFLDSKTAYNSQVPLMAEQEHMHLEERHVFLDIQRDQAFVRRQWSAAVTRAREQGYAVVIGHVWCKETAAAIRDSYETLQNQGYTFHTMSELYP